MSEGEAKRQLDKKGLQAQMKGKAWNAESASALIDEDPRAYKDIRQVMADQSDLSGGAARPHPGVITRAPAGPPLTDGPGREEQN